MASSNPCGCGGKTLENNVAGPDPCGCGGLKKIEETPVESSQK